MHIQDDKNESADQGGFLLHDWPKAPQCAAKENRSLHAAQLEGDLSKQKGAKRLLGV